jgi:hypothetical protein
VTARTDFRFTSLTGRNHNDHNEGETTPMNRSTPARATLALACALALAGEARAFEIGLSNSDLSMRWDNTVRYNAGVRVQDQDTKILGNPNFDDGDRNFAKNSLVTNRVDVLSEFDFVWKRSFGARVSAAGWVDGAYSSLDNTNTATANTLQNGLPVAGALSPYTKRYTKGPSGEILDAFVFGNFDAGNVPVSIKAGQHTAFWGESLLLGGAVHSVSYSQYSLDLQKGFMTPGSEAKELFRPRGGITMQVQPAQDLAIVGQWFYNWQAVRIPESGSYLTIQDGLNFGGQSIVVGAQPVLPRGAGHARAAARVEREHHQGFGIRQRPAQFRSGRAMEPGMARRHARLLRAQLDRHPAASAAHAGHRHGRAGRDLHRHRRPAAAGQRVHHQQECDLARRPAEVRQVRHVPDRVRQRRSHLRRVARQADRRHELRRGALVPAEHAAAEQPRERRSRSARTDAARFHRHHGGAERRHAGRARRHVPRPRERAEHPAAHACVDTATLAGELTWMRWDKVTQNMAVFKGNPAYTGIDKVSKNYFGLAINFTPTWFQVLPAWTCRRR